MKYPEFSAKILLALRSTEDIVEEYELTEKMWVNGEHREELPLVREWIMDELEKRDNHAFMLWIDDDWASSPRKYYIT